MNCLKRVATALSVAMCMFAAMTMVVVAKPAPAPVKKAPAPARPTAIIGLDQTSALAAAADEKADSARQGVSLLWQAKSNLEAMVHLMAADQVKVGRQLRALTAMRKWERELPADVKAQVKSQIDAALTGLASGVDVDAAINTAVNAVKDTLNNRIDALENRVTNAETAVEELKDSVTATETSIGEIKERVGINLAPGGGYLFTSEGSGGYGLIEADFPTASAGWTVRGYGLAGGAPEDGAFIWGAGLVASLTVTSWCELGLGLSSVVFDRDMTAPGNGGYTATVGGEFRLHLWKVELFGRIGVGPHTNGDPVDVGYEAIGGLSVLLF